MDIIKLIDNYNKPNRCYHNFLHVSKMFGRASGHNILLTAEQKIAILYHDVIYVPGAIDNEERSKDYMLHDLHFGDNCNVDIDISAHIIMDTKDEIPTIEESRNVIDLDLYELFDEEQFKLNSILVQKECCPDDLDTFRAARIRWLEKFLARETIYVGFMKNFESFARENLENELEKLKKEIGNV